MKEIDGWVKVKKYTADGKPVCGGCHWNKWRPCCDYQQNTATYGFFVTRLHDRIPGPSCPIWYGESKGDIVALMEEIAVNKETCMAAGPEPQFDADEPRYSVYIIGPKRLLEKLANLIWELPEQENKPWNSHPMPTNIE